LLGTEGSSVVILGVAAKPGAVERVPKPTCVARDTKSEVGTLFGLTKLVGITESSELEEIVTALLEKARVNVPMSARS
jgi:hypothetical protein